MHICRYFHDDDHLPPELRETLEAELYATFAGDRTAASERVGSRDAGPAAPGDDSQRIAGVAGIVDPPDPADPIRETLTRLTRTVGFTRYTRDNIRLSERIAHEAVHWVGERWGELEQHDPFEAEERAVDAADSSDPGESEIQAAADVMTRHRPELAPVAALVVRPGGTDRDAPAHPANDRLLRAREAVERRARLELLRRRWRNKLERDRANHRARLLGRALGSFVRDMERIVPRLAEEQAAVRDIFGNEDALWDLSQHEWESLPIHGLKESAAMLAEHPEIERLAEILGKSKAVTERLTRERVERRVRTRVVGIGKSEVTGIRAGDDLTSLVASEVGLLSQPETEDLFYAKLARRELLVLDYHRQRIEEHVELRRVSVSDEVPAERGPAIVCVDTSGSMLGLPEQVAKATVLALAQRLQEDNRRLEIIAFSSQVRSFAMDPGDTNLAELARFLEGSFHGGTDLGRALATALETLERDDYRNADVLVISDFRVPKIADKYLERINRRHREGTLFHSLTVSRHEVIDPLHIFDSSWLFSTESGRIAPESLRAIG